MQVVARRVGLLAVLLSGAGAALGAAPLLLLGGALGVVGVCAFVAAVRG